MQFQLLPRVRDSKAAQAAASELAERQGFEPWVPARTHLISSQAHSAALAPLQSPTKHLAVIVHNANVRKASDAQFHTAATLRHPAARA